MEQLSLFDAAPAASQPLAARLRPESLEEFVGQQHLIGPGKVLRRLIESDQVASMIFWGPPGLHHQAHRDRRSGRCGSCRHSRR